MSETRTVVQRSGGTTLDENLYRSNWVKDGYGDRNFGQKSLKEKECKGCIFWRNVSYSKIRRAKRVSPPPHPPPLRRHRQISDRNIGASDPGGGLLRISSHGDDRRIFLV